MPKVSVIIPVYGVEKYIERCAMSLFEQTLRDIEYIFVDDSTPDESIKILKRLLKKFPYREEQVKILHHNNNKGLPQARRTGIEAATGEYIIHCDSDDWVDPKMYQAMYDKAIVDKTDLVICNYVATDGISKHTELKGCHSSSMKELIHNSLLQRDPWSLCNKLFKRKAYYNIEYPTGAMGEDMLTVIQLIINCQSFSYIPMGYYYYYDNMGSISKLIGIESTLYRFKQAKENIDKLICILQDRGMYKEYQMEINYVQFTALRLLQPTLKDSRCFFHWQITYPRMGIRFICNPYVSIKNKIKYILSSLKLYPFTYVTK